MQNLSTAPKSEYKFINTVYEQKKERKKSGKFSFAEILLFLQSTDEFLYPVNWLWY